MKQAFFPLTVVAILAAMLALSATASAATWNGAVTGAVSWNNDANWTSPATFPNSIDASAIFPNSPTANMTVNLLQGITVGSIDVTNSNAGAAVFTLANGTGGSLTFDVTSGNATFTMGGTSATTNNVTISASVTLTDTLNFTDNNTAAANSGAFTGTIIGGGGLIKNGAGGLSMTTVSKAYTGATTVNQGRLRFTNAGQLTGTSSILVNSGGQLFLDGSGVAWSFGGGTAVITINGTGDTGAGISGAITKRTQAGSDTLANPITLGSDATIDVSNGTLQLNGKITGNFSLTKTGSQILVLANTGNDYTGNTTNTAGTLRLGASGVIPDTSVLINTASQTIDLNGFDETVKSISGAGTLAVGVKTLTLDNPSGESYSGVFNVADGGKMVKNGAGALTASGGNNNNTTGFRGEFIINNGTVGIGNENVFGGTNSTTNKLTINGGKLSNVDSSGRTMSVDANLNGDFTVDDSLTVGTPGSILFNRVSTIRNSNRTITVDGASTALNLANVAEDTAGRALTKAGTGTLILSGANSFSGNTRSGAGALNLSHSSALQNSTLDMNGADTGTVNFTNSITTATFGGLTGSRDLSLLNNASAAVALSVGNNGSSPAAYSGVLSGGGSLTKIGAGTLVLSNANTYGGGTTISSGTLLANFTGVGSSTGSAGVFINGGTLGGKGNVGGAVTFDLTNGGTIAPGGSVDTLTVNASVAMNSMSNLAYDLAANDQTVGSQVNDLLVVTDLTLDGTLSVTARLPDTTYGTFLVDATQGKTWRLINYTNLVANNGLDIGTMPALGAGLAYSIEVGGGAVNLVITAVPEAGAFAAVGLVGLLSLGGVWIRKLRGRVTVAAEPAFANPQAGLQF